jgi:hypothetical protein
MANQKPSLLGEMAVSYLIGGMAGNALKNQRQLLAQDIASAAPAAPASNPELDAAIRGAMAGFTGDVYEAQARRNVVKAAYDRMVAERCGIELPPAVAVTHLITGASPTACGVENPGDGKTIQDDSVTCGACFRARHLANVAAKEAKGDELPWTRANAFSEGRTGMYIVESGPNAGQYRMATSSPEWRRQQKEAQRKANAELIKSKANTKAAIKARSKAQAKALREGRAGLQTH